jgi:predicted aspartyl protease
MIVVEAALNGHKLPALIDTGAEVSIIDAPTARELGLSTNGTYEITALDGRKTQGLKAPIHTLVIGGLTRFGGRVVVADLSGIKRVARQPFAMVVGADVLSKIALAVNWDGHSVIVMPSNVHLTGSGWIAPLHLQAPDILTTEMLLNGHPATVRVDTGADDEVILRDTKWGQIVPDTERVTSLAAVGAAGVFVQPMVRLDDAKMSEESIGDVIATRVPGTGIPGTLDGVLGMGILSRFNLFLNPNAGIMVLTRPKKAAPPRGETMVGIQGPPTDQGIAILHIMAHSPAEAAGLKEGDRICTVDGEKVSAAWVGTPKNDWMTGPEGKTVVLGRCGGGTIRLTLRRFY